MGGFAIALFAVACRPSSIGDAEAKGDVQWLETEGSPAAVGAIGRLADKDPKALDAIKQRAKFDKSAYLAAWDAVKRGASWGSDVLHAGLQDPSHAEDAGEALDPKDAAVAPFLPDVDTSFTRLAAGGPVPKLANVLAIAGPPAHQILISRLADKITRGPMCQGIGSSQSSPDARSVLRSVPPTSRDDAACVTAVVAVASNDDVTLKWVATAAEPGLLGAVSKQDSVECPRLHTAWVAALASRLPSDLAALTVPLGHAVKRCQSALDGVLADAIKTKPDTQNAVVGAIDPFSPDDVGLKATCGALKYVLSGPASPVTKERAADALEHGCKGAP